MLGRNTSTPPTPPMMPSTSSDFRGLSAPAGHRPVMKSASAGKPGVDQIHHRGAEAERQGENDVHQAQKYGDTPYRMHGEPVDAVGHGDLAVGGLVQKIPADFFDELVAQAGQLRFGIVLVAGGELGGHP